MESSTTTPQVQETKPGRMKRFSKNLGTSLASLRMKVKTMMQSVDSTGKPKPSFPSKSTQNLLAEVQASRILFNEIHDFVSEAITKRDQASVYVGLIHLKKLTKTTNLSLKQLTKRVVRAVGGEEIFRNPFLD